MTELSTRLQASLDATKDVREPAGDCSLCGEPLDEARDVARGAHHDCVLEWKADWQDNEVGGEGG